jgi:hypothetical protein
MKRVKPLTAFVVLLLMGISSSLFAQSGPGIGTVEFVDGDVRINGELATFGQEVGLGDWVETGPNSTIEIVFDRGNIFELGPNTVAKLDLGEARQQVDLKFGTLSAVFERVRTLSGRGTFDVRTSTALAGVRGTTFFLRAVDGETTYVCTCNGSLELLPGAGNPFVETAAEHSAYFFTQNEDGEVEVESAEELYHDNESLNTLADRIGAAIPWGELPDDAE